MADAGAFGVLPVELHSLVLAFLSVKDVVMCSAVSKVWKQLARQEELWKHLFLHYYDDVARYVGLSQDEVSPCENTWYNITKEVGES